MARESRFAPTARRSHQEDATMPNSHDAERLNERTQSIKDRLEEEFPDHGCVPLHGTSDSVFRLDDRSGTPRYRLMVSKETLTELGISEPNQLFDEQNTVARMKEAGMAGVRLRHPILG